MVVHGTGVKLVNQRLVDNLKKGVLSERKIDIWTQV